MAGLAHENEEVNVTETVFPFANVLVINVEAVWPVTAVPFTLQIYPGFVPPLVALAVNVILCPAQIVFPTTEDVAETEGATWLLIATTIGVEVAVSGLAQPSDEVN